MSNSNSTEKRFPGYSYNGLDEAPTRAKKVREPSSIRMYVSGLDPESNEFAVMGVTDSFGITTDLSVNVEWANEDYPVAAKQLNDAKRARQGLFRGV